MSLPKRTRPASSIAVGSAQVFNQEGHLNTKDREAALSSIMHAANQIAKDGGVRYATDAEIAAMKDAEEKRIAQFRSATTEASAGNSMALAGLMNDTGRAIEESMKYMSFIDRIFEKETLKDGEIPRLRKKFRTFYVNQAIGPFAVSTQRVWTKYVEPEEVIFMSKFFVDLLEMKKYNYDVLGEKSEEMMEIFLVAMDRLALALVDSAVEIPKINNVVNSAGIPSTYNNDGPASLGILTGLIEDYRISPRLLLLSTPSMRRITYTVGGNNTDSFASAFDPATRFDIVHTGNFGSWYGQEVLSDAPRNQILKVVPEGRVYAFGPPDYVGQHTEREMYTQELGMAHEDTPGKGYQYAFPKAMVIANQYSCARLDGFGRLAGTVQ